MRYLRFSIGTLMGLVLLVAVGFAALRSTTLLWASATFSATVLILSVASLWAAARGPSRLTWGGFAAFGWVYLLTTFWFWPGNNGVTAPPYLPKLLMDHAMPPQLTPAVVTVEQGFQGEIWFPDQRGLGRSQRVIYLHNYRRIGHTLAAILVGVVGAILGRLLDARVGSDATTGVGVQGP